MERKLTELEEEIEQLKVTDHERLQPFMWSFFHSYWVKMTWHMMIYKNGVENINCLDDILNFLFCLLGGNVTALMSLHKNLLAGLDFDDHSIPFHSIPFHSIPFHSIPIHSEFAIDHQIWCYGDLARLPLMRVEPIIIYFNNPVYECIEYVTTNCCEIIYLVFTF